MYIPAQNIYKAKECVRDAPKYLNNNPLGKEFADEIKKPKTAIRWILMGLVIWRVCLEMSHSPWTMVSICAMTITIDLNGMFAVANGKMTKRIGEITAANVLLSHG